MLAGHQVSVDTVIEYMQLLIDACFISEVKLYTRSKAKQLVNRRKFYCVDHCFVLNGRGPKFETMVYNNLISKRLSVNYYLEEFEVDFIVSTENEVIPIQACISVVEDKTFDREIGGILRFYNSHFSIQNKTAYVITKNETSTEKIGDITVEIVKFEDFFMNIDKTFRLDITDDIEF